jgi:glutamyl/glutaminyl-tRNA synthetase
MWLGRWRCGWTAFVTLDDKAQGNCEGRPYHVSLVMSVAALKNAPDWTPEHLETVLRNLAEQRNVAAGKIFQPIRIALTGGTVSEL